MNACVICNRPHRDTLACGSCVKRLTSALGEVPGLMYELEVTRCRLDVMGSDPGRSAETPMMWREKASEAALVLHNTLGSWARHLWGTWGHGGQIPVRDDTADIARFLCRYPSWLAGDEAAAELDDEIRYAVGVARRAIDTPADSRIFLGRCDLGEPLAGEPACATELWAMHANQTDVECPTCGSFWLVTERRSWLAAVVEDETATAEVMSGLLFRLGFEITPGQIQKAARDGLITNVGIDSHTRRRRYRVGSVLDACLPGRVAEPAA